MVSIAKVSIWGSGARERKKGVKAAAINDIIHFSFLAIGSRHI